MNKKNKIPMVTYRIDDRNDNPIVMNTFRGCIQARA